MDFFIDILSEAAIDTLRLAPFLFLTYLAMEYLENKAGEKTILLLSGTGKKGPLIGGLLGVIPQCGFSAASATLYSGGVITAGTLLAVFLSTSDEMLPILLSGHADFSLIAGILLGKAAVGILVGILVDMALRAMGKQNSLCIHELCEQEHCRCEEGSIARSALIHTLQILAFLFLITAVLNLLIESVGMEHVLQAAGAHPVLSVFFSALIGLIPNCAASVAITTFYLEGLIPLGSMFAGLLSCAGIGLLVLLRTNRRWKQNLFIFAVLYASSVLIGIFLLVL